MWPRDPLKAVARLFAWLSVKGDAAGVRYLAGDKDRCAGRWAERAIIAATLGDNERCAALGAGFDMTCACGAGAE